MKKKHRDNVLIPAVAIVAALTGGYFVMRTDQPSAPIVPAPDIVVTDPVIVPPVVLPTITYRTITLQTSKPGAEIAKEVGLSKVPFVLAFNRLDVKHMQTGATITIPSEVDDWNALSPFPHQLDAAKDIEKIVLVSQRIQAFAAYEHGILVRWGTVSTGKKETQTPSKLYFTNWKGKSVVSTLEGGYILPWAFNLDNMDGIAMHQFDLPGYPASHSCVRMSEADAMWMYDWAKQWILAPDGQTQLASGTPVIIFGQYTYGKTAPWKTLATTPDATTLTPTEVTDVVNANMETIVREAQKRALIEGGN